MWYILRTFPSFQLRVLVHCTSFIYCAAILSRTYLFDVAPAAMDQTVVVGKHVNFLTWATAGALLTAQITPSRPDDYVPIYSEILCWMLVVAVFELSASLGKGALKTNSTNHGWIPWIAAVSITVAALSSSVEDTTWIVPTLSPVLVALRHSTLLPSLHQTSPNFLLSRWSQAGIGIGSILALGPQIKKPSLLIPLLAVSAYLALLVSLIVMFERNLGLGTGIVRQELGDSVKAIAYRAITLLVMPCIAMLLLLQSSNLSPIGRSLWVGCAKGLHWASLFWIMQEAPWETATAIWTFAAASKHVVTATAPTSLGLLQPLCRIVAGFLAIYQTIAFLPKCTPGRYILFLMGIWPVVSLLVVVSPQGRIWIGNKSRPGHRHPIEELIIRAQTDLIQLVDRQSKTLEQAKSEYRRRYTRDPPPGFDEWFAYAVENDSIFVDDFDMIDQNLKPFWKISPQRLSESIDYVTQKDELALRKCGFANGEYFFQGDGWIIEHYGALLQDIASRIPDVSFAFNILDEPRGITTQSMLESGGVPDPQFRNANHQPIWNQVIGPCSNSSKIYKSAIYDYGIPFIQNWAEAKDVCRHPEYEDMHGFFASPETCILTDAPVPIISQAAPSSFSDILYPSPWYTAKYSQTDYVDKEDPPWDQKINKLYWAGSTTGSRSTGGSWKYSHRQRFVKFVQAINETSHMYLRQARPGVWESYTAKEDLKDLFNVKLTAVIQCDDRDCDEQKEAFSIGEHEERSAQFHSRFIFDTDGNAFSGRYYTVLQSRSVVLKQTVLREWHDERLIPWIHFIPVSLSMQELPEIMKYMTLHTEGQKRAKEVADASREWQKKVLRREDFTIYLYRLMLELSRIMDPKREIV